MTETDEKIGITPIYRVLEKMMEDEETKAWIVYGNKTEEDILLRDELDEMCRMHGEERIRVYYTVSNPKKGWAFGTGRISREMLKEHLPVASCDGIVLACGPEGMISEVVRGGLAGLGWDIEESVVVF